MNQSQPPVPDDVLAVLRQAEASLFTGSVVVSGSVLTGTLYLDAGRIYWASIPGEPDLSEIVARLPVNSIMLARIRWHMANGLTLARALGKLDDIDHAAIQRAVRDAADDRIVRLLSVDGGKVQLTPDAVAPVGVIATWPLPVSPTREPAVARSPGPTGAVTLLAQSGGPVELDEVEWRVVSAFAAPQSVDALATRSGLPPSEVMAAVERLRARRLAAVPTPPPAPPPSPALAPPPPPPPPPPSPPPPSPPRPTEDSLGGDRRSNALRRLISAVRGI